MSRKWYFDCTVSEFKSILEVDTGSNFLPFSGTWGQIGGASWGEPSSGTVSSWGTHDTFLQVGGAAAHILYGFTQSTVAGDSGTGEKSFTGGEFPDGSFDWKCTSVDSGSIL
jgi:hypothetical protein